MGHRHMKFLAVGLNPQVQKTLIFEQLQPGCINRAESQLATVGGKSIHFAIAGNTIEPASTTVAYFRGGETGEYIQQIIDDYQIPHIAVEIPGKTRVCTTLLCRATGQMTELIEPSPEIPPAFCVDMRTRVLEALGQFDGIGLCGTWPLGIGPEFYAEIAANKGQATLLLDSCHMVEQTLQTGQVDILKLNTDEITMLCGTSDVFAAATACRERYNVEHVAVTDGPGRAFLWSGNRHWVFDLPALDGLLNPIGAGDTVSGVMLVKYLAGMTIDEAFAQGLAAASASCKHLIGAKFNAVELSDMRPAITVTAS